MKHNQLKKILCTVLCAAVVTLAMLPASTVRAASSKTFLLAQAENMALSNSKDVKKVYNNILMKEINYVSAVKGAQAKAKNKSSFRWTPLFGLKFPQPLNMTEEYGLKIKPVVLQSEINTLRFEMEDMRYEVINKATKAYQEAFLAQEQIDFTQKRLTAAQTQLARNEARLVTGEAAQNDVEVMKKKVTTLTGTLAQQQRIFEAAKTELGDQVKLDLSTGYSFVSPLKDANIPRSELNNIINYTLSKDLTYYQAKMDVSTTLLNINSYESLMRNQYGWKMNYIQGFVNTAKSGGEVDYVSFRRQYDAMLNELDKPWYGRFWIIFFPIQREWLKGEISGSRYVEDDMYALYSACQEYESALTTKSSTEKSVRKEVSTSFESLVTARNAYFSMKDSLDSIQKELNRLMALNKLGKAEFSEVSDKQDDYETAQLDALDALGAYNTLLSDFDRLTCGAVTKYLKNESLETGSSDGAKSYANLNIDGKPYYSIYTEISDQVFVFGLEIPDDFKPEITEYEIWYDGVQIGERTPISKQIRHLALDYKATNTLTVRLYNGDVFVDECEIDTSVPRDVLPIKGEVAPEEQESPLGRFTAETTARGNTSTTTLTITPTAGLDIAYYSLADENGAMVYTKEPLPIGESFLYLTLLAESLDTVKLTLYDAEKKPLYTARFDTETLNLVKIAD